jgi:hypothetical protein
MVGGRRCAPVCTGGRRSGRPGAGEGVVAKAIAGTDARTDACHRPRRRGFRWIGTLAQTRSGFVASPRFGQSLTGLRRLLESRYAPRWLRGWDALGARRHLLVRAREHSRFRGALGALVVPAPGRGDRGGYRDRVAGRAEPGHVKAQEARDLWVGEHQECDGAGRVRPVGGVGGVSPLAWTPRGVPGCQGLRKAGKG